MFPKPPITPPPEHPRLFLRQTHLPELRAKRTRPEVKQAWERLEAYSRYGIEEANAEHCPGDVYVIEACALLYLLNDDREAGLKAKAMALSSVTKDFNPNYQDISREIGRLMLAGAIVYDWCYELVTDEERAFFIRHFKRLAGLLECGYPPVKEGAFVGHSCEWMIQRDMLGTGIAIYDEDPEMYDLAAGRFFDQMVPARNFFYPSGWHHQGDGYGGVRFQGEMFPTWMYDRMGFGNVYDESQREVGYQWIYTRRPDGKLLRDGDSTPVMPKQTKYTRLHFIYLMLGGYFKDPYYIYQMQKDEGRFQDKDVLFAFLFADPDVEARPLDELPLTRYFGAPTGVMVARTGWEDGIGSGTVVAEMKVGMYQYNNHQHLDAGAFQLYYKGNLAIDSGSYKGSSGKYHSPHNKYYFKRTIAHNSMLVYDPGELEKYPYVKDGGLVWPNVNDGGQRWPNEGRPPLTLDDLLNKDFKRGDVLAHAYGPDPLQPDYSYLKGDLTAAYSDKMKQFQRSFLFLNFKETAHPAVLIVFDRVVSAKAAFSKHWLLHSIEEPHVEGSRTTVSRSEDGYNGQLVNDTLLPEPGNQQIAKIGGPGQEYWVFGTNYVNDFPGTKEQGEWRIEVSPREPAELDLFLNVMQVKDIDGPAALPVQKVETGTLTGVRIRDWIALFAGSGERLQEQAVVPAMSAPPAAGGPEWNYLVADLAAGVWTVAWNETAARSEASGSGAGGSDEANALKEQAAGNVGGEAGASGRHVATVEVTEEGGLLHWRSQAVSGAFTLTYGGAGQTSQTIDSGEGQSDEQR
ncbi:Heparin and heparin-sulfate lyase [Paenibacillus solanacearum]|uniref:Heparin and heparin-sulfate lyase n=1 Tax=Paenibacillus solanacearum TaxID=2048548 RepID=A0A916K2H3_9BACL|nr:heparin/heparin-sulfate lyase HepB [Paenibacillus solanacearum]CAG7632791.1 Heparin and heparin-sulfate lyase [Paenibacillus solanacearum]